jgi:hypothetical protein
MPPHALASSASRSGHAQVLTPAPTGRGEPPKAGACGRKVSIVWFRNDLRLHDHEALTKARALRCIASPHVTLALPTRASLHVLARRRRAQPRAAERAACALLCAAGDRGQHFRGAGVHL